MMTKLTCESCNKNKSVGVACVPGVPYSAAYCGECLDANSHPMHILVANTACCGGLEHCTGWWKDIVESSLKHQGKDMEWFTEKVKVSIRQLEGLQGGEPDG